MPGGRPTKYTPQLLKKAQHYVENYEEYGQAFPSDIGLASACGISDATLYVWAKDPEKQEFIEILEKVNRDQQFVAWNKGLRGEYNANLVKLLLGKHGFKENSNVDLTSKGDKISNKLDEADLQLLTRYGIIQKGDIDD